MALAMPGDPLWRLRNEAGRLSLVTGMLNDADNLRSSLASFLPEACVHLAWYAEPGAYLHSPENINSLMASLTLLKELTHVECRSVVIAGTCAEYDTDFGLLREETVTRPKTLYAAAKLSCCLLGEQIAAQAQMAFAWARIFYPYGPQEDCRRLVPAAICALQRGRPFPSTPGEQIRDYIHVEDVAAAFCLLTERRATGVFNICSGEPVAVRDLLAMIGRLMGRESLVQIGAQPYRAWEPPFICGDNHRLRQLGWTPGHTLSEGLWRTIQWWVSQGPEGHE